MPGEIVNLNKVRKAKERAAKERKADANRLKFGQPKPMRSLHEAEKRKLDASLDAARRETGSARGEAQESEPNSDT